MSINIDVGKVIDNYLDADEVADWAIEQMEWAVDSEIYEGEYGKLTPKAPAKRWMLAEMLLACNKQYGE